MSDSIRNIKSIENVKNTRLTKKFCLAAAMALCMVALTALLSGCAPSDYTPQLSDAKIKPPAIQEAGVLKVGVNADNAPLAYQQNSKITGIDVDVAAAIADQLGLKLEVVDVGRGGQDAIKNKKVDIVMGLEKSASTETELWKSDPYLQTGAALFSTNPNAAVPKKTDKYKFATKMGTISAALLQNQFESQNIRVESELKNAFSDLKNGTVDYVAADAVKGSYTAFTGELDVTIIALLQNTSGYCIGISNTNTELQAKVKAALTSVINNGVISSIECKYLGKNLNLDSTPKTEQAGNQASASDIEKSVYGHETGSAEHS